MKKKVIRDLLKKYHLSEKMTFGQILRQQDKEASKQDIARIHLLIEIAKKVNYFQFKHKSNVPQYSLKYKELYTSNILKLEENLIKDFLSSV